MRPILSAALLVLLASLVGTAWQGSPATPASKKLLFLTHAALYKHTSLGPAENAVVSTPTPRR